MLHPTNNSADVRNLVLAALPAEAYERLARSLEPVKLETGKVFHEIGEPIEDAYFINHGIISKVIVLEDGATVEIGVVGREGAIGISALLGAEHSLQRNMVQIAGDAWRIKIAALKAEFNRGGQLQAMLLRFMRSMM